MYNEKITPHIITSNIHLADAASEDDKSNEEGTSERSPNHGITNEFSIKSRKPAHKGITIKALYFLLAPKASNALAIRKEKNRL